MRDQDPKRLVQGRRILRMTMGREAISTRFQNGESQAGGTEETQRAGTGMKTLRRARARVFGDC